MEGRVGKISIEECKDRTLAWRVGFDGKAWMGEKGRKRRRKIRERGKAELGGEGGGGW